MLKQDILITVVDGQGGGIGRQYIESLRKHLPKDLPVIVRALGTNSAATANMMRAGATDGATGENAIIKNAKKADIIVGVVAIVVPDSIRSHFFSIQIFMAASQRGAKAQPFGIFKRSIGVPVIG